MASIYLIKLILEFPRKNSKLVYAALDKYIGREDYMICQKTPVSCEIEYYGGDRVNLFNSLYKLCESISYAEYVPVEETEIEWKKPKEDKD